MIPAAFLKVFQYPAVQLIDVLKALHLHKRPRLLAADPAGTKHHHRLFLHLLRQLPDRVWKLPESADFRHYRAFESPQLDLVVVARVQQRDLAAFVQPLFQLLRRQLGRGAPARLHPLHTEGNNLLLDPHQHPAERLVITHAPLPLEIL